MELNKIFFFDVRDLKNNSNTKSWNNLYTKFALFEWYFVHALFHLVLPSHYSIRNICLSYPWQAYDFLLHLFGIGILSFCISDIKILSRDSVTPILIPITAVYKVSTFNKLVLNNILNAILWYQLSDRPSGEWYDPLNPNYPQMILFCYSRIFVFMILLPYLLVVSTTLSLCLVDNVNYIPLVLSLKNNNSIFSFVWYFPFF